MTTDDQLDHQDWLWESPEHCDICGFDGDDCECPDTPVSL